MERLSTTGGKESKRRVEEKITKGRQQEWPIKESDHIVAALGSAKKPLVAASGEIRQSRGDNTAATVPSRLPVFGSSTKPGAREGKWPCLRADLPRTRLKRLDRTLLLVLLVAATLIVTLLPYFLKRSPPHLKCRPREH